VASRPHRPKAFYDTSVLVAASVRAHPRHAASAAVLAGTTKKTGFCASHSLAELYATLTALPLSPRVHPSDAFDAVEHRADTLHAIALNAAEFRIAIREAAARHAVSGQIYDALILAAAETSKAEIVYTWDVGHFRRLASESLAPRIQTPPPVSDR
jgi:predicted nucleic acid-binding protein